MKMSMHLEKNIMKRWLLIAQNLAALTEEGQYNIILCISFIDLELELLYIISYWRRGSVALLKLEIICIASYWILFSFRWKNSFLSLSSSSFVNSGYGVGSADETDIQRSNQFHVEFGWAKFESPWTW